VQHAKASFFLTGNFYRNPVFHSLIRELISSGHYLGPHSNNHLLYCDWTKRDSLLVTRDSFERDLKENYDAMKRFEIDATSASYFLPPYEWYNDSIAGWTKSMGLQLINYTPGTLSHADYTTTDLKNYRSSEEIMRSIRAFEKTHSRGLNGFVLLMHIGAGPGRTDKFYSKLPELISWLKSKNYKLVRIDELLRGSQVNSKFQFTSTKKF
jgi:peptidoglycan/xylan/chitin deacetylase (PgdA/CDA1 family)